MNIIPIKTDIDYRNALKRLDEIFNSPIGSPESDEADNLGSLNEKVEEFKPIKSGLKTTNDKAP